MPAKFNIPAMPEKKPFSITNFLGVDKASKIANERRTDNGYNFINKNGTTQKRPPLHLELVGQPTNQIYAWNNYKILDVFRYSEDYVMYIINRSLASGTNSICFYKSTAFNDDDLQLVQSFDVPFPYNYTVKKVKFGDSWIIYCNKEDDSVKACELIIKFTDDTDIEVMNGYIPTTIISRNPDGTAGTVNEEVNLLTLLRKTSFLCTTSTTVFKLESGSMTDDLVSLKKLGSDGTWTTVNEGAGLTINRTTNEATVSTPIGASPVDNRDNVIIQYGIESDIEFRTSYIANLVIYGYENNDRLFINTFNSNKDYHSTPNDATYFPASNISVVGANSPIIGYAVVNNRLMTFKDDINSVWVRIGLLLDSTEVFASEKTISQEKIYGIVYNDEHVFALTYKGIFEVSIGSNIEFARRSFNIDPLLTKKNITNFSITLDQDYLYIKDGREKANSSSKYDMYVADLNVMTNTPYLSDSQYEWYLYKNLPYGELFIDYEIADGIKTYNLFIKNEYSVYKFHDNLLPSESLDGKFYDECPIFSAITFPNNVDPDTEYPRIKKYIKRENLESYWETPYLNMNNLQLAKVVKTITLNTASKLGDKFELGYILPDGTSEIIDKTFITNNSGFPQILYEKIKISKFMWIKFYIKSLKDSANFDLSNYWPLFANGNDIEGSNNGNCTDVTFSENGAQFNGSTSKISLTSPLSFVNNSYETDDYNYNRPFVFGFNLLIDHELGTNTYMIYNSCSKTSLSAEECVYNGLFIFIYYGKICLRKVCNLKLLNNQYDINSTDFLVSSNLDAGLNKIIFNYTGEKIQLYINGELKDEANIKDLPFFTANFTTIGKDEVGLDRIIPVIGESEG